MPVYEYRCEDCGKITEFLEGVGRGETERKCKYCGSERLSKVLSRIYVASDGNIIGSQGGRTCCGRSERCEKPPCSDDGGCIR